MLRTPVAFYWAGVSYPFAIYLCGSIDPWTLRQKLLMQFLSVLGVIEGMYTFGRDISAE